MKKNLFPFLVFPAWISYSMVPQIPATYLVTPKPTKASK